jgi:RNA polymerase sigma-70 factor (ECF subfamily)
MFMTGSGPAGSVRFAQESMHQLREAIRRLPPEEKEVFLLRQNGEWTYGGIAQWHTPSVEVVKDQMRSSLRKLRSVLQEMPLG